MMYLNGYGMGHGFGWLFMIVFWVLIILGIAYLIKMFAGCDSSKPEASGESAEDILKKRFAGGDLNKEEFEEAMEVLMKHK